MTPRSCAYASAFATATVIPTASAIGSCFSRSSRAQAFAFDVRHHIEQRAVDLARIEQRQKVGCLVRGDAEFGQNRSTPSTLKIEIEVLSVGRLCLMSRAR
jgi:hypothetical protein